MAWVIQDLHLPRIEEQILVFAALIGGDLGPKMLPIGSLAALLWFRILRNKGVYVPYSLYIKVGVPVTLAAIVLSIMMLNVELWIYRLFLN
jgi:arsenical pump membrane protein